MEEALRTRLLNDAGVSALVGTRIDWGISPQGKALPRIVLTIASAPRDYNMAGAMGTQMYRVQIDCWAETYKAARDIRNAVFAALEPASGEFQGGFVEMRRDTLEDTPVGQVHRCQMDMKITHIPA